MLARLDFVKLQQLDSFFVVSGQGFHCFREVGVGLFFLQYGLRIRKRRRSVVDQKCYRCMEGMHAFIYSLQPTTGCCPVKGWSEAVSLRCSCSSEGGGCAAACMVSQ